MSDSLVPTLSRKRERAFLAAVVLVLSLLYFGTRLIGLDSYVTTDEPFWLGRSANFYRALSAGDYADTYQMAHPGVLTMWAGTIGYLVEMPDYPDLYADNLEDQHFIHHLLLQLGEDPLDVLNAGRIAKIGLQTFFFAIALVYVLRLFGAATMAAAGGLIAFDPLLSGLDSVLHLDGLFAITTFAALLSICYAWRREPERMRAWFVAGMLAACAWLTRWTGLALLVPLLATLVSLGWEQRLVDATLRSFVAQSLKAAASWLLGGVLLSLLLWPALWSDPGTVFSEIWDWSSEAAADGHELPTFFRGEIFEGDPGWLFYPFTLAWRLSPIVLVGVALAVAFLILSVRSSTVRFERSSIPVLLLFGAVIVVGMSLGAKKFDRYISPVYPILDLLAAIGFVTMATLAMRRWSLDRLIVPLAIVAVVGVQTWGLFTVLPYRLDYFNPLLGGSTAAESELQLGWGQGAKKTLDWLEENTDDPQPVVIQVSGSDGPFMYFMPDNIYLASNGITGIQRWCQTDYFIGGIQQWQRDFSKGYQLVEDREPEMTVQVEGVDYFRVYDINGTEPPAELGEGATCSS